MKPLRICRTAAHACAQRFNVPHRLVHHLLGPEHKPRHRFMAGAGFMAAGAGLAHLGAGSYPAVAFACDVVGYAIHALGFTPFVEHALKSNEADETHPPEETKS